MDRKGTGDPAGSHALEGAAVALAAWLAASAVRTDLDLLWQTMAMLFRL